MFFDFIDNFKKIIITSHENPDPDALGSEYALCKVLLAKGYNASIMTCEEIPVKCEFIDSGRLINVVSRDSTFESDALTQTALIVLDTNTASNTGFFYNLIKDKINDVFIIDHHEIDKNHFNKKTNLINVKASSTCEIIYELSEYCGYKMDHDFAQAVFAGILYDTGLFVYPKTEYKTMQIASDLLKACVKPNIVYSNLYETNSLSSLKLQSLVFSRIKFFNNNTIALQVMLKEDLENLNARFEDGDSIINLPMKCRDILVSVFFKENKDGVMRCSLRSKENIDVSSIARKFGGGGHTTAAGFKCHESLDIITQKVLKELKELLF